ncbi:MAG: undecaprenyl-phosphate glucose phosphotransferase [Deltaproteobacteria bacterium]|nr:undecaprenyl-phosphate glucose phosphotransferase [Deltaproteobacteria bacterium]
MADKNRKVLTRLITLADLISVVVGWLLAYGIRFHSFFPVSKGIPDLIMYLKMIPFLLMTWFIVFSFSGLYKRIGTHRSPLTESLDVLQACIISTLFFISISFFYDEYRYSRLTLVLFAVLHPSLILLGRSLIRKWLRRYRKSAQGRRFLLIGSGPLLNKGLDIIRQSYLENVTISQLILTEDPEYSDVDKEFCQKTGIKSCGIPENWADFLTENPCDSVLIAIPYRQYDSWQTQLKAIADQITDIRILPDLYRLTRFATGIDLIAGTPVISIHESPMEGSSAILKRCIDIIGALTALLIFSPLMLLIALLIRLSAGSPVLYRQQRMGLDGKTFSMMKFRSMPHDSESTSGAVWASKSDQRATPLGAFLRKSSLDELPQLFNVLKGDMSLVGPRPERPVFVNQFRHKVPGYMLRHKVKAGMTGWAQINGWRGDTSIDKRIECDLYYIQNWSLWLDIRILFLTVVRGFVHPNAY